MENAALKTYFAYQLSGSYIQQYEYYFSQNYIIKSIHKFIICERIIFTKRYLSNTTQNLKMPFQGPIHENQRPANYCK